MNDVVVVLVVVDDDDHHDGDDDLDACADGHDEQLVWALVGQLGLPG